jgi:peptidylprolyl isomerase
MEPKVGQMLQAERPDNTMIHMIVIDIAESSIKVDANPPLAGKTLNFEIELVEIAS